MELIRSAKEGRNAASCLGISQKRICVMNFKHRNQMKESGQLHFSSAITRRKSLQYTLDTRRAETRDLNAKEKKKLLLPKTKSWLYNS